MANDTAKTSTINIVPVQGIFEPLPPYECVTLIGPAGTPFTAPISSLDGVSITNSTINSTTIGAISPTTAAFTTATASNQPVSNNDLCNKLYVDALATGISWKQPVLTATDADITLSGAQTIGGVAVVSGDRVLVKDQSSQAENGIYVVSSGLWNRSEDANSWNEMVSAMVFVESGDLAGQAYYCPIQPGGTLGVTAVTWSPFSVSGTYFAGTGLNLTGSTFSIANTSVTAASYGSASSVPTFTVNAQGQLTAASNASIAIAASQITSGTINTARISGTYSGITGVGTLTDLTVSNVITGSISGNAATATTATTATKATNLAGGTAGSLPYQSATDTTTFLSAGVDGQVLSLASGVPTWTTVSGTGDVVGPASSVDNALTRFDGTTGKAIQTSSIIVTDAGGLTNVNEVLLDTTPNTITGGAGSLSWNSGDLTADLVLNTDVTLQLGQENLVLAYNNSGSTITNGSVVAVNGAQGQRPAVVLADADTEVLSAATLGVATQNIAAGAEGFVTTFGVIRGINTSGFTAGDPIYLSQTAGQFTATRPSAPAHTVFLGWVLKVNASSGELFLNISNGWELDELHNVKITSVANNDLLQYNSSGPYWQNVGPSSVSVGAATNLSGGATGSLPYQSGAGTTSFLAAGTDGQVLKLSSGIPTWSSDASGVTISDDTTTNATRYLTFTSATTGTITTENVASTKLQFNPSTGVLTATGFSGAGGSLTGLSGSNISTGTVGVAYGGTGQATYTNGQLLIGNSTGNTLTKATLTQGTGITITNGSGSISIANAAPMTYPGAGIPNSTGSAWGTSYTTTGSGTALALATSPSFTTPTLGVASATSINKVAITAPASGSTLTIADGKTLTANNSLTLAGTDSTTMTFPSTSQTVAGLGVSSQVFTTAQTFRAASAVRSEAASTQDAVVLAGRAGGTSSYAVTLTPTTLSSSTTLTLPNVTDTVAVLGTAQTFTAVQTLTDPAIIGTICEDVYALSDGATVDVDPGNGSIQTLTLAGTGRTLTFTNMIAGEAVTLMINDGSAGTITTWNATFVNNAGAAPTLSTTGYTVVCVWKVSTTVYAAVVGNA